MATKSRVLVNPAAIEVEHRHAGGLPVVNAVLGRLGVDGLLSAYLPQPDQRVELSSARAIGVLIRNLVVGREPLYGLSAWAGRYEPDLVGLAAGEAALLHDERVGRALDELFLSDRASLLTALSLAAIRVYRIDCSELHNDSTSLALYGAYAEATGTRRGGVRPAMPARAHSKDHRPDLLQLVWILTVSADGTVPLSYRLADGSTEDSTTHVGTWDDLVKLLGRADFIYVADCKLATREAMGHIVNHHGRFLTVLPRTRKEDEAGRAWLAGGGIGWEEIVRSPGQRRSDPDVVYWAVEAPACSAEGLRICWIRSSQKRGIDAAARTDRIERASAGLAELKTRIGSSRCQMKSRAAIEAAASAVVAQAGAARWVRFEVGETLEVAHRQERRGRPGAATRYRRIETSRFSLSFTIAHDAVAYDAASDGCFPFVTTERQATPAELLRIYKAQPHLERRHATFKGVIPAAPLMLKSDRRIDALGFCLYVALLVHALVERELRRAMTANKITTLPLYPEERDCKMPTAARVFELLAHPHLRAPRPPNTRRRRPNAQRPPVATAQPARGAPQRLPDAELMTTIETLPTAWALLNNAFRARRPVEVLYHGRRRLICPHALGWSKQRPIVLGYQTDGDTSTGSLPADERKRWRCLFIDEINEIVAPDPATPWGTADNYNHLHPFAGIDNVAIAVTPDDHSPTGH